jgi:hypothetical protein
MHTHCLCVCSRSKPWQALLDEAKYLVASGVRELNLIAEDTNQYGMDRCARLLWRLPGEGQAGIGSKLSGSCLAAVWQLCGSCMAAVWQLCTCLWRRAGAGHAQPTRHLGPALHLQPLKLGSASALCISHLHRPISPSADETAIKGMIVWHYPISMAIHTTCLRG